MILVTAGTDYIVSYTMTWAIEVETRACIPPISANGTPADIAHLPDTNQLSEYGSRSEGHLLRAVSAYSESLDFPLVDDADDDGTDSSTLWRLLPRRFMDFRKKTNLDQLDRRLASDGAGVIAANPATPILSADRDDAG